MTARKLAAGNWKMNGLSDALAEFDGILDRQPPNDMDVLVCPPATLLRVCAERATGRYLKVGGQDCHAEPEGAHTGDVSAPMLADAGATHVILGHSERRANHGETDALVAAKALAAIGAKLTPIICVGETLEQRDGGQAVQVVLEQLAGSVPSIPESNFVIAYEPVWAIGTGRVAGSEQISEMHAAIRKGLSERFGTAAGEISILYGGSVKPSNAEAIFTLENVDGALVGGASLKSESFLEIIEALEAA